MTRASGPRRNALNNSGQLQGQGPDGNASSALPPNAGTVGTRLRALHSHIRRRVIDITLVRQMVQDSRGAGQSLDVRWSTGREHCDRASPSHFSPLVRRCCESDVDGYSHELPTSRLRRATRRGWALPPDRVEERASRPRDRAAFEWSPPTDREAPRNLQGRWRERWMALRSACDGGGQSVLPGWPADLIRPDRAPPYPDRSFATPDRRLSPSRLRTWSSRSRMARSSLRFSVRGSRDAGKSVMVDCSVWRPVLLTWR